MRRFTLRVLCLIAVRLPREAMVCAVEKVELCRKIVIRAFFTSVFVLQRHVFRIWHCDRSFVVVRKCNALHGFLNCDANSD